MALPSKSASLAFFICVCASTASAQKVTLHSKGKENGAMILETKINPDGSLAGMMDMTIFGNKFHYTSHILPSGMPQERDLVGTTLNGQKMSTKEIDGAHSAKIFILSATGKKTTLDLPYINGLTPKESHVFWFIKTHPKVGDVDTYLYFNLASKKWEQRSTKYAGEDKIEFHGKTVFAHKLLEGDNASWVDNKGMPYLVDFSKVQVRFFRDYH